MNTTELATYLASRRINPDAVSIGVGIPTVSEKFCVVRDNERWEVYYSERGLKTRFAQFASEEEACTYLLSLLDRDKSVWL